jgi:hypothetical protein
LIHGSPLRSRQRFHAGSIAASHLVEGKRTNGLSLGVTFEGEFSNVTSSFAGKGVARYQW